MFIFALIFDFWLNFYDFNVSKSVLHSCKTYISELANSCAYLGGQAILKISQNDSNAIFAHSKFFAL